MQIIEKKITLAELKPIAARIYVNMVKAVVDIERGLVAIDAELHSDLESFLLQKSSKQKDLWGINLYPDAVGDDFLEYDSMINLRPSQGNRSRGVESEELRNKIMLVVKKWVIL